MLRLAAIRVAVRYKLSQRPVIPQLWWENEEGDRWYCDPREYPVEPPTGYIYQHSRFPSVLVHRALRMVQREEVDACPHDPQFVQPTYGWVDGIEGRECKQCHGTQTKSVGEPWPTTWEAYGSRDLYTGESSWPVDLALAMTRPTAEELEEATQRFGTPPRLLALDDAITLAATSCGRCLNALLYRYGLGDGYPRGSEGWNASHTSCEICNTRGVWEWLEGRQGVTASWGLFPLSESKLPGTDPAPKGVTLDTELPGQSTFAKPPGESPRDPKIEDTSMYRRDNADDLLKNQTLPDSRDHQYARPTYRRPGPHVDDDSITKYPNRDEIPNRHNAALVENVVQLWLLRTAHEVPVSLEGRNKVAVRLSEIARGLNPKVTQRARSCTATLKRADVRNLRWIFSVDCGNGSKMVRLKASRKRGVVALAKMDVSMSCSCKAWRWLGSEHHAQREKYLDGKPVGTASDPIIKDPDKVNRVCKHVASVIDQVRKWTVPSTKKTR